MSRIQKVLSNAGFGSRREIERHIADGLIKVNDKLAKLGDTLKPGDKVTLRDKILLNLFAEDLVQQVILYHKPTGEICSRHDPHHENSVFDKLPKLKKQRWVQVGRLDINTSGLLIFTTDGALANKLMHPTHEFEREYAVRVYGRVTQEMLKELIKGVKLDDGLAKFERINLSGGEAKNSWYHVVVKSGRNRMVRRLWESQGVEVSRLMRIRFGNISLPHHLRQGKIYELSALEIKNLANPRNT